MKFCGFSSLFFAVLWVCSVIFNVSLNYLKVKNFVLHTYSFNWLNKDCKFYCRVHSKGWGGGFWLTLARKLSLAKIYIRLERYQDNTTKCSALMRFLNPKTKRNLRRLDYTKGDFTNDFTIYIFKSFLQYLPWFKTIILFYFILVWVYGCWL